MSTIAKLMVMAAAIAGSGAASAQVTYDYSGGTFEDVLGPYTTSDSVQGSMTFAAPLSANLDDAFVSPPVSYSFSDGLQTLTNLNSSVTGTLQFWTNAEGAITGWSVDAYASGTDLIFTCNNNFPTSCHADDGLDGAGTLGGGPPGVWSLATAAPEIDASSAASGLVLLVGGLVVLRSRKQLSTTA